MNVCGVTFGGYIAKKLSFKLGNLLYKSNFYLLSEGAGQGNKDTTVSFHASGPPQRAFIKLLRLK